MFSERHSPLVMPGLVPGIHALLSRWSKNVDGRDKPGHDARHQRCEDSAARSALPSHRAAPMLQRRPDAARQAKLVDGGGAAERLKTVQLDAAPLEAAFLEDVARGRVAHARAGKQLLAVELLEVIVDRRAGGLGAKALAPVVDAKPVAELRRVALDHVDADHADWLEIALDQECELARLGGSETDELDGMILRIGMRKPARILGDAAVIGETRNCFYVRERRPAQAQPFGLEDARTRLAQGRGQKFLQHRPAPVMQLENAKDLETRTRKGKGEAGFPPPLQEPCLDSAGLSGPGGLDLIHRYSAASVIGSTDTTVRPLALARNSTRPSTLAKRVWSVPMPTLGPGCEVVPRWRAMMLPGIPCSPPNALTPRRLPLESRPFRDEPPAFL